MQARPLWTDGAGRMYLVFTMEIGAREQNFAFYGGAYVATRIGQYV
jgi:hypothetical protein